MKLISKINSKKGYLTSLYLVPFLFGIWSLLLGQDRNWDLNNYHLYNAFAFLNNKLNIDFAVAGLQSYFNPLADIPYYLLLTKTSGELTAFFMGLIHGMNFILLMLIIRHMLSNISPKKNYEISIFLALSGCLTGNFLSGLGNSMGDDSTLLLGLSSFYISLKSYTNKNLNRRYFNIAISGLIFGLASGLKLTNGVFAIALCLSFLAIKTNNFLSRLKLPFIFGLSVLFGYILISGYWHFLLWNKFHNPVFPLYSNFFQNEFSSFYSPKDSWGAKNFMEFVLFPFLSSLDYHKAGRGLIHQFHWPLIYTIILYISLKNLNEFFVKTKKNIALSQDEIFIVTYISIGYVLWVIFLANQRYMVNIDTLTPLIIFILLKRVLKTQNFDVVARKIIIASTVLTLLGGFGTWGHTGIKNPPIKIDIPTNLNINESLVLIPNDATFGWMVTQFPSELPFIRLAAWSNKNYIEQMIKKKNRNNIYIIIPGASNWRIENVTKWSRFLSSFNLLHTKRQCEIVQAFIEKIKFRGAVKFIEQKGDACYLVLKDSDEIDIGSRNSKAINDQTQTLLSLGLTLNPKKCDLYNARFGSQNFKYIWCSVKDS